MTLSISLRLVNNKRLWPLVLAGGYAVTGLTGLHSYIHVLSVNCILGLMALAVNPAFSPSGKRPHRFAWAGALFSLLYWILPAKTLLFAAVVSGILFLVETFYGMIRFTCVCTLAMMCPIFEYVTNIFSFPLRLSLTSFAGRVMQLAGEHIHAEGNVLVSEGAEFSIDPACMGLHMLIASLTAGVMLIGVFERKTAKRIRPHGVLLLLICICALNVLSNLFRIICLVHFKIGADTSMHQLTGIVCFALYVLLPSSLVIRAWTSRYGRSVVPSGGGSSPTSTIRIIQHFILLSIVVLAACHTKVPTGRIATNARRASFAGYQCVELADHITKLENARTLIYVKPVAGFYCSDHQPTICWAGSGYQFKKVQAKQIAGMQVYSAVLEKKTDILYTAWWYEDGSRTTISQFEWRWHAFTGSGAYDLINVTVATPADLEKEIRTFIRIKHSSE